MIEPESILFTVSNLLRDADQFVNEGRHEHARESAERAVEVARMQEHPASLAAAYYGLAAVVWGSGGDAVEAHRYAALAADNTKPNTQTDLLVRTLVARIKTARGNFSAAQVLNEDLLTFYREAGIIEGEADILRSLGDIHKAKGEYNRAEERYRQSLSLYNNADLNDPINQSGLLISLGSLMFQVQRFDDARDYWTQARNIAVANGYRHVVEAAESGLELL